MDNFDKKIAVSPSRPLNCSLVLRIYKNRFQSNSIQQSIPSPKRYLKKGDEIAKETSSLVELD